MKLRPCEISRSLGSGFGCSCITQFSQTPWKHIEPGMLWEEVRALSWEMNCTTSIQEGMWIPELRKPPCLSDWGAMKLIGN